MWVCDHFDWFPFCQDHDTTDTRNTCHVEREGGGVERMGVNSSSPAMKNKITKKKKILNLFWTFLKEKSERKKINLDITDREIDASDSFLFVPTTLIIKDHIQWNRGKKKRNKRKFKWFFLLKQVPAGRHFRPMWMGKIFDFYFFCWLFTSRWRDFMGVWRHKWPAKMRSKCCGH